MAGCFSQVDKPNVLFDIGENKTTSHIFEVKPGEVVVVSAQGLMEGDVIAIETVTGCGLGDMCDVYVSACGCPVELSCCQQRVVIPFTGRYRACIVSGNPGDYRVTVNPTSSVGYSEGTSMAGCNNRVSPGDVVDEILASPSALAGICQGVSPCVIQALLNDDPSLTEIAEAVTPEVLAQVPGYAQANPGAFTLVEDTFGVDLGYMFPA